MGKYIKNQTHFMNFIKKYLRDNDLEIVNYNDFEQTLESFYQVSLEIEDDLQTAPYEVLTWELRRDTCNPPHVIINSILPEIISETIKFSNEENIYFKYIKKKTLSKPITFDVNKVTHAEKLTEKAEIELANLHNKAGIYFLYNDLDYLIYIGKSTNLENRILVSGRQHKARKFAYIITETKADRHILEPYLILKYAPESNTEFMDTSSVTFNLDIPNKSENIIFFKESK